MSEAQSLSSVEKAWLQNDKNPASFSHNTDEQLVIERAPSETRMEDDFRPSVLTPIHEVPTRSRLHTAETDLIHNCCIQRATTTGDVPSRRSIATTAPAEEVADDMTRDDVSSVVSSLSKDDSFHPRPPQLAVPARATLPPTEVSIPTSKEQQQQPEQETPDWLSLQQPPQQHASSSSSLQRPYLQRDQSAPAVLMDPLWKRPAPRVRTVFASPKGVVRPTLGRNQSCPASPRMDFSIASKTTFSTMTGTSSSCGDSIDALFNNTETDSLSLSPKSQRLLGERKMRTHRRVKSMGQSSLLTAPTLPSTSYAGSESSLARRNRSTLEASRKLTEYTGASDGTACCSIQAEDSFRKRNLVKEELKHLRTMVATPIKKLPLIKRVDPQQNLDLTRSGGCLT